MSCEHPSNNCVNPYELIRKYSCESCHQVMMCSCDKDIGTTYLSHQLNEACELDTQKRIPVDLGFQDRVCPECRGFPPITAPKAELHGATSKIKRYYWRELSLETIKRFGAYANSIGCDWLELQISEQKKYDSIQKEVLKSIKEQHKHSPKYDFSEKSQSDIISEFAVPVLEIVAEFPSNPNQSRKRVTHEGQIVTADEFATNYYQNKGYSVLRMESRPLHVIYAVLLNDVLSSLDDELSRVVEFGDRNAYNSSVPHEEPVSVSLPTDFGTAGFWERKSDTLSERITFFDATEIALAEFDRLKNQSQPLLNYLWVDTAIDLNNARNILGLLESQQIRDVLTYLAKGYWSRYLGWPDFLIKNDSGFKLVEVKGSGDKLSKDQKDWIAGNAYEMQLPFELLKVIKPTN